MSRPKHTPPPTRRHSLWGGVEPAALWVAHVAEHAAAGGWRVPAFQRPFCWEPADEAALWDSLDRGVPVGTIVVWQTGPTAWLIDGQQRVTSLARAWDGTSPVRFDMDEDRYVVAEHDAPASAVRPPARYAPVRAVLETAACQEFLTGLYESVSSADDTAWRLARDRGTRLYAAAARLHETRVGVLVVHGDEALAREVFRRINTAGRPLTEAEVFNALAAT